MSVEDVIIRRGIVEVVHFTTETGLLGVLDSRRLKSRERVEDDERLAFILQLNADIRKDPEWLDYVSMSISEINSAFFEVSALRWHPELRWYILAFDPVVLTHESVYFVTTNNIYPAARRGLGQAALEAMFGAKVRGRYGKVHRRPPEHPDNRPTDDQAEVLYPGEVSTEYLRRIYVTSDEDQDNAMGQLRALGHPLVEVVIDPSRF